MAEHITAYYQTSPLVMAVLIGGSVSRKWADDYSDLEIGVFWERPPSDEERKNIAEQVGAELWMFQPYQSDSEWVAHEHWGLEQVNIGSYSFHGTSMISINHLTASAMEKCLSEVVEGYDTALKKQVLIAAIQNGIFLHGTEFLQRWQQKAVSFPDELAIKIVQENLWFGPWFCPEAYAERDDKLVLFQHFIWAEQSILRVLAALNRIYYISGEHKWIDAFIAMMSIVPHDLSPRMKQIFRVDAMEGWRQLMAIIDETIALVDEHLPAVNTLSLFPEHPEVNTAWARKRWETHSPYTLFSNQWCELKWS